MRSIGADHVLDYTRDDFTRGGQHYDLIFDCHPSHSPLACRRVLNSNGIYVAVGGPTGNLTGAIARMLTSVFLAFVASRFASRKLVMFVAKVNHEDLSTLAELAASGKVTPVIEKSYRLSETAQAMRDLDEGHSRGKLVVSLGTGQ
jgi:NADPH:quinone reductase-like Zn-dependent oxidoreductase